MRVALFGGTGYVGGRLVPRLLDAGHEVVQCYLDVENPDGSVLATASAMTYWAGNRMVQLARDNLGWSAEKAARIFKPRASALMKCLGFLWCISIPRKTIEILLDRVRPVLCQRKTKLIQQPTHPW